MTTASLTLSWRHALVWGLLFLSLELSITGVAILFLSGTPLDDKVELSRISFNGSGWDVRLSQGCQALKHTLLLQFISNGTLNYKKKIMLNWRSLGWDCKLMRKTKQKHLQWQYLKWKVSLFSHKLTYNPTLLWNQWICPQLATETLT